MTHLLGPNRDANTLIFKMATYSGKYERTHHAACVPAGLEPLSGHFQFSCLFVLCSLALFKKPNDSQGSERTGGLKRLVVLKKTNTITKSIT